MLIKETETEASNSEITAPEGVMSENSITQLDHRTRQRMTPKPPMKLLAPKSSVKIWQWNVRTMYEAGKCAQVMAAYQRQYWSGIHKGTKEGAAETVMEANSHGRIRRAGNNLGCCKENCENRTR